MSRCSSQLAASIAAALLAAACGGDASPSAIVTVSKIPPGTTALEVTVYLDDHEAMTELADTSAGQLAAGGDATFAVELPVFAQSRLDLAVKARVDDCAVASGETGCDLPGCGALRLELGLLEPAICDEAVPDAGLDSIPDGNEGR